MNNYKPSLFVCLLFLLGTHHGVAHGQDTDAPTIESDTAEVTDQTDTPAIAQATVNTSAVLAPTEEAEAEEVAEPDMMDPHPVSGGISFRPGSGLRIQSDDGAFSVTTRFRVQILHQVDLEDESDATQQFMLRRARVQFGGHFFGEDNRYKLQLAISPRDLGIRDNFTGRPSQSPLLDYYLEFRQLRDLTLRIGQYKVPHNRQRVTSSGNLQMVDRSIVNSEFNLDRDLGFDIRSRNLFGLDMLRYNLGIFMARGRGSVGDDDFGMMYLARLELLPMGSFQDYREANLDRGPARLAIGLGGAYIDRARRDRGVRGSVPADGGTTDTVHLVADAIFVAHGFSAETEFMMRSGSRNAGDATDGMGTPIAEAAPRDGWGLMVQTGYILPTIPFEISARFGMIRPTGADGESALGESNELGLGLSYYFAEHPFKLQFDAFRLWNEDADAADHRLRLQLQASI